jgi:hypothetical protein
VVNILPTLPKKIKNKNKIELAASLTDYHDIKVEPLADTLAVPLVREVCEPDVASQFPTDDISHIRCRLGSSFGVL